MGDDVGRGEVVRDVGELELSVGAGKEERGGLTVRGREGGAVVERRESLSLRLPIGGCEWEMRVNDQREVTFPL